MCNIAKAIKQAFTPPGTGALMAQQQAQQQQATDAASSAETALTAAIKDVTKASLPVLDNPAALLAQREQQKKLLAAQGAGFTFSNAPMLAPTVGTQKLLGQ